MWGNAKIAVGVTLILGAGVGVLILLGFLWGIARAAFSEGGISGFLIASVMLLSAIVIGAIGEKKDSGGWKGVSYLLGIFSLAGGLYWLTQALS